MSQKVEKCPVCSGDVKKEKTIFSIDFGFGILVVRDVPSYLCMKCGSEWHTDDVRTKLETIINDAEKRHSYVEITKYDEVA